MIRIETERLVLRDFIPDDREAYIRITGDPLYQRFYSEADCSGVRAAQLLEQFVSACCARPRSMYRLAIVGRDRNELIGTCGLRLQKYQQASMGCGVGTSCQGTGYAREAIGVLLDYGFQRLDIHRGFAETLAENESAVALCKRLGMRCEAHFRERRFFKGRCWDGVVYTVLKSEWTTSRKRKAGE